MAAFVASLFYTRILWSPRLLTLVASTPCTKSDFVFNLLFSLKEQHVSPKTFFDKPVTRIIRYITNNGEQRDSKYILSAASPPPVPCKCHLWNIRLFVLKHKTFLPCSFSKCLGVFSVSELSHSKSLPDEMLKIFIFKARTEPIKAALRTYPFSFY